MKPQPTNIFVLAVLEEMVANGKIGSDSLYTWFTEEKYVIEDAMMRLQYDSKNEIALESSLNIRTSERDVAENDVAELLKPLRTIYDALTAVGDWGDLGTILDGSTVDQVGKFLKAKEPRYRGYSYLNQRKNGTTKRP